MNDSQIKYDSLKITLIVNQTCTNDSSHYYHSTSFLVEATSDSMASFGDRLTSVMYKMQVANFKIVLNILIAKAK